MSIKRMYIYIYNGKEYKTLNQITQELENSIGRIVDGFSITMTPMQKLAVYRGLVANKEELCKLLETQSELEQFEE